MNPEHQPCHINNTTNIAQHLRKPSSNIMADKEYLFTIGLHNINRIMGNDHKLLNLLDWSKLKDIDVLGITETNITQREGNFRNNNPHIKPDYIGYWSDKDSKIKGSGVGIILNRKWEPYVGRIIKQGAYYLEITLFLKKCTLIIGTIYMPPNDKEKQKSLLTFVNRQHSTYTRKKYTYYSLIGDFNSVVDRLLNHTAPNYKNNKNAATRSNGWQTKII